jgi:TolB protein
MGTTIDLLSFTPDLSRLLFTLRVGTRHQLYLKSPTEPWPPPLLQGDYDDWGVLSPDGRRVAFERAADHDLDLWVVGADGTGLRRLAAGGQNWTGSFSPDGSHLAYLRFQDGAWNLWTIGVDGSDARQLTSNRLFSISYADVTWSPCGLIWARVSRSGEVWALRLDRQE